MESERENGKEMVREWGNEKMERERKWKENGEMERGEKSPFSLSISSFSLHFLSLFFNIVKKQPYPECSLLSQLNKQSSRIINH